MNSSVHTEMHIIVVCYPAVIVVVNCFAYLKTACELGILGVKLVRPQIAKNMAIPKVHCLCIRNNEIAGCPRRVHVYWDQDRERDRQTDRQTDRQSSGGLFSLSQVEIMKQEWSPRFRKPSFFQMQQEMWKKSQEWERKNVSLHHRNAMIFIFTSFYIFQGRCWWKALII